MYYRYTYIYASPPPPPETFLNSKKYNQIFQNYKTPKIQNSTDYGNSTNLNGLFGILEFSNFGFLEFGNL